MARLTLSRADGQYTVLVDYQPAMASTRDFDAALKVFASELARSKARHPSLRPVTEAWDGDKGEGFPLDPTLAPAFEYPR
jgi:hypothetical protein